MILVLVAVAVVVLTAVLLEFSSVCLLLVVYYLKLASFRLYLGLLLFFALLYLLLFGLNCLTGVLIQVNIHVRPLFE